MKQITKDQRYNSYLQLERKVGDRDELKKPVNQSEDLLHETKCTLKIKGSTYFCELCINYTFWSLETYCN